MTPLIINPKIAQPDSYAFPKFFHISLLSMFSEARFQKHAISRFYCNGFLFCAQLSFSLWHIIPGKDISLKSRPCITEKSLYAQQERNIDQGTLQVLCALLKTTGLVENSFLVRTFHQ